MRPAQSAVVPSRFPVLYVFPILIEVIKPVFDDFTERYYVQIFLDRPRAFVGHNLTGRYQRKKPRFTGQQQSPTTISASASRTFACLSYRRRFALR